MKKQILYTVLLACLATACSESREPGEAMPGDSGKLSVPLEIASATIEGEATTVTRAGTVTNLTSGAMGIFLEGKDAGTTYTAINNCQYKYNTGTNKWEAEAPAETIYLGGENAQVCAYYPFKAKSGGYDDKTALPLTTQDYAEAQDISYATNSEVNGTSALRKVTFGMTHAYSQIELKISRENYPSACAISKIELQNASLATSGTINITNGALGTPTIANYSLTGLTKTLGSAETYTRALLMVPTTLTADLADIGKSLMIALTVDGQVMTAGIPTADLSALKKGEKYVIGLKIKGTEIVPTVTAVSWTTADVNTSDDEYEPKPKTTP